MSALAGRLRARLELKRPDGSRDALGGASGGTIDLGLAWAWVERAGHAPAAADTGYGLPLWRVTMRDRDLRRGDVIVFPGGDLTVRDVTRDPDEPDRLVAIGEQGR